MERRAEGAHCTGAASGAAGGTIGSSAGHFLVLGHCRSEEEQKDMALRRRRPLFI